VGLVYVGADAGWGSLTREFHFSGGREAVRGQAAEEALRLAAALAENYPIETPEGNGTP